jgi:alginate O-acetyltransferase complex protein AlgJ
MTERELSIGRWFDYLLIGVFLIAIFAPLSTQLFSIVPGMASTEKRKLAERPAFPLTLQEVQSLPERYNSFLDDRFGLRPVFLRVGNWLRWELHLPITPKVLIGKEGWLFLGEDNNVVQQFRGIDRFTHEELVSWVQAMVSRSRWLSERGIPFIVLVAPNKHTIYPEYLPDSVGFVVGETPMDQLSSYIRQQTELDFIDCRRSLKQAKRRCRVFLKLDSHWNDVGSFIGYQELMRRVVRYFPQVQPLTFEDYVIREHVDDRKDLAQMLDLQTVIFETAPFLIPKFPSRVSEFKKIPQEKGLHPYPIWVATGPLGLPTVMFFHDSFGWAVAKYLIENFSTTFLVGNDGLRFDTELIDKVKPDLVIYELAERAARQEIKDQREIVNIISEDAAAKIVNKCDAKYRNVEFGNTFVLLGLDKVTMTDGSEIQLAWKSLKDQRLLYNIAIHFVNSEGEILSQSDYPQNKQKAGVTAGAIWLDKIRIPRSKLDKAKAVAIGIYSSDTGLLTADRGPRDWGGTRLLVSLTGRN